jgi:hypothetical protein
MIQSKELYSTLTLGEKKLISRDLSKSGKVQLLTLFKGLSKPVGSINFEVVLGKSTASLATLFNQLRSAMLTSLNNYQHIGSLEVEFRTAMNEIEILKNKFLYKQALKKISSLKKNLLSHERFSYLQEVSLIEIEINYFLLSEREFHTSIMMIQSEYELYRERNEDFFRQKFQFYQALGKIHDHIPLSKDLSAQDEFSDTENRSAMYYHLRTVLIQKLNETDRENAQRVALMLLDIVGINRHEFEKLPFQLLEVNFMCGLAFLLSGKMDEYAKCVREMYLIREKHLFLEPKFNERYHYLYWIEANISAGKHAKLDNEMDQLEEMIHTMAIEFRFRIIEQVSNYLIEQNEFKPANKWNRIITNVSRKNQIQEFVNRAELRAIYIYVMRNRIDMADTLIDRLLSSRYSSNFQFGVTVNILHQIQKAPEKRAALLLPVINFWKYASQDQL